VDEERIARTEATFREVNEAIARTASRFESETTEFVCECADPECTERVTADLADYEEVRSDGTHFLVTTGHDEPRAERVVERADDYVVVEKFLPSVARIVRGLNPRAA
jgi:hypothetical protein